MGGVNISGLVGDFAARPAKFGYTDGCDVAGEVLQTGSGEGILLCYEKEKDLHESSVGLCFMKRLGVHVIQSPER